MAITRNSPCVCGSGRRFKSCCGAFNAPMWTKKSIAHISGSFLDPEHRHLLGDEPVCTFEARSLPPGVLIRWLSDDYDWKAFAAELTQSNDARAAVVIRNDSGQGIDTKHRVTDIVELGEWKTVVREVVRRAYRDEIEPFFDCRLRWFSAPEILRYGSGGYYRPHADSDNWDPAARGWERVIDRHLSLLIYLDDGYNGGELVFPNFSFRLRPQAGMLVAFPSDHRYLHGAMPVLSGIRHVVVSWAVIEGEELLDPEMPSNALPR